MIENLILFNSRTLAPDDPNQPSQAAAAPAPPAQPPAEPPAPTRESIRQSLMSDSNTYHKEYVTDDYVETELEVALQPKLKQATEKMQQLTSQWVRLNPEKIKENPRARGRWWYDDLKRDTYARIEAGGLKSPTLIIWGFNDPSGRPSWATISTEYWQRFWIGPSCTFSTGLDIMSSRSIPRRPPIRWSASSGVPRSNPWPSIFA